jgi:hypothetical protein
MQVTKSLSFIWNYELYLKENINNLEFIKIKTFSM